MDIGTTITLRTGRSMPILGLGTWQLTRNTTDVVKEALGVGYPMIDTAGNYGTQPGIAEGIKQSGIPRSSLYITTKIESTEDAYEAAQRNVQELQVDSVDLTLIHWPPSVGAGEDLWRGLIQARDEGFTGDIGVSNYSQLQIQTLIDATGETPVVNQIEWHPFNWSQTMLSFCKGKQIVIQAYSPLSHAVQLQDETLARLARGYGKSPAQLLIRWGLQKRVVPLPKANDLSHLRENLDVFDFEISADDMHTLDVLGGR